MDHDLILHERIVPAPGDDREVSLTVVPNVRLEHRRNGAIIDIREFHNLVTDAGKAGVASRISGYLTPAAYTFVAIGTGTTPAAAGDTALQIEITTNGGERADGGASPNVTSTVTNDTAVVDLTYNFTGGFAVTESGLLNAISSGTLLARQTFAPLNVVSGDSLTVTWKIIVG